MKQFLKDWILPPMVLEYLKKKSRLLKFKTMDLSFLSKNIVLKDKYKGKRCFILGNAPTINDIDITLLKDEHVFLMSTFYNHPDYKELNKTIYTSVRLTGSNDETDNLKWMKTISDNTSTTDTFVFDIAQKSLIEKYNLFGGKSIFYVATANVQRGFDLSKITKNYETNIIQALEIAFYMGFSEIYLHSVNINVICNQGKYEYFFDRKLMPYKDPGVNDDDSCKDFFSEIEATYVALKNIYELKKYAESFGINVYYTNKESLLKFFKFKAFDDVIRKIQ